MSAPSQLHEHVATAQMATTAMSSDGRSSRDLATAQRRANSRLSMPFAVRAPLGISLASFIGFALGSTHGSSEAGFRFRAENAHRLPKTQAGWYLYHKSKNYHKAMGGLKEGLKMAGTQAAWWVVFVGMEEAIDGARLALSRWRHGEAEAENLVSKDVASTALAGVGTAGAFSVWKRLPLPTAVRMAKLGLKGGLAYGLLQDFAAVLAGRRIGYVDFVKRRVFGSGEQESHSTAGIVG